LSGGCPQNLADRRITDAWLEDEDTALDTHYESLHETMASNDYRRVTLKSIAS